MYYESENIYSGLITGTMWDVVMKFISESNDGSYSDLKNMTWGNYKDIKYNDLKGRYIGVDGSGNTANPIVASKMNGLNRSGMLTTASTEGVKKKNIYDLAANMWEWTQEAGWMTNSIERYMLRGGGYDNFATEFDICYRNALELPTATRTNTGMRPVLFLM